MRTAAGEFDVIVVGAGMVGAALAVALGMRHLRVAILDRGEIATPRPAKESGIRVSAINAGSEIMLRRLGVWPDMTACRVSPYDRMFVWDAGSGGAVAFSGAELGEPHLGHIIENNVLLYALHRRIRQLQNIIPYANATPGNLDAGDAAVTLDTGHGPVRGRLLVGADGAQSWVRDALGIDNRAVSYHQGGIVAQVRSERSHERTAWQRFLPTGPLAFLPLASGDCSIVWSCEESLAAELLELDDNEFAGRLGAAFDHRLGAITRVSPRSVFALSRAGARGYVAHRGVLVGDAAHSIHPLAGQGVNLGFADAAALTEVLTAAVAAGRDIGARPVLRRYERWRKGENLLMSGLMDMFVGLFGNSTSPMTRLRGLGMRAVDATPPVKHLLARRAMGLSGDLPALVRPGPA